MNLVVNGFHHPQQLPILFELIEHFQSTRTCAILAEPLTNAPTGLQVFTVPQIIDGDYGEVPTHALPSDFLDFVRPQLFDLLNMTTRFEVYRKNVVPFEERKKIIFKHLTYWYSYFSTNPVHLYISSNIPHDIYDFAILVVARYFQTKTLYFLQSQFRDLIIPMEDYRVQNLDQPKRFAELSHIQEDEVQLHPLAQVEWDRQMCSSVPFYMKPTTCKWMSLLRYYASFARNTANKVRYHRGSKKLRDSYQALSKKADYSTKFIYFPLHYQPEMTSCPLGGHYNDQYLAIQQLDAMLPEGTYLYVKEHPKQLLAHRHASYYQDILAYTRKTILVDFESPSVDLIRHSQAVATITGTAGWEALFKGKPVLLFGNIFFQYAPGVFQVNDTTKLSAALQTILSGNYHFSQNQLKIYLNSLVETSIYGYIDSCYAVDSASNFSESNQNILSFIRSRYPHA